MSTKPGVTYAPSASIDAAAVVVTVADLDDPIAVDRDIATYAVRARAVDDRAAPDHHVMRHCPLLPKTRQRIAGRHDSISCGNPLAGEVKSNFTKAEFCEKHNLDISKPVVVMLPGSSH